MSTMTAPSAAAAVATGRRPEAPPLCLSTTLYDLLTAIQDVVSPADDALVVATAVHLLQSRRLTVPGQAS
jgi:hypothetical protein